MARRPRHTGRRRARAWPLFAFLALLGAAPLPAQGTSGGGAAAPDTAAAPGPDSAAVPPDSAAAGADSAAAGDLLRDDRPDETAVRYRADTIDYQVDRNLIRLVGHARVGYKDISITADSIDFFTRDQQMVVRSHPVLHDREDAITGDRMIYDFKARRGWIYNGSTAFANGRYWGRRIRQVGERTLNVDHGRFTTCDADTPHFYFWSRRMKIYLDDKMVAEPVALCFSGIPVLAIPFYFFPLRRDRHSGFLMPRVGSNNYQGMFVKNLAYYQVLGDQADVTVAADLYEYVGWQGAVEGRWWRLPRFASNAHYTYLEETDPFKRRWSFSFDHNQTLGKRTRLSGSGNFVSDKSYYSSYSEDRDVRMQQELRSYLALNHNWTSASAGVVADYSKNLVTRTASARLPEASFESYGKDLFGKRLQASGRSYLASFLTSDTLARDRHQVWDNQVSLSSGLNVLRHIRLSPSARLVATWYDRDTAGARNPVRYFYSGGVSAGTTLYGLLPVGIGPLLAFRHQFQPSVTYSWAPRIDQGRFHQVGSAVSSYGQQQSMYVSAGNTFAVKFDRRGKTRKADLLTWHAGTGLDLLSRPRRWSALSSNFNVLPGNPLVDCHVSTSYDWRRRMNQYTTLSLGLRRNGAWSGGRSGGAPAVAAADAAAAPDSGAVGAAPAAPGPVPPIADSLAPAPDTAGLKSDTTWSAPPGPPAPSASAGLPWSLALSYDQNWLTGQGVTGSGIRGSADLQLTRNWTVSYGQYYDIKRRETVSRDYSIKRDLHCWEASFASTKSGVYWSYEFRINIKKIPEIKLNIPKTGQVRYE
jgi:lipopolysaccharide export system protein LptA